jgi:hypothetical protein
MINDNKELKKSHNSNVRKQHLTKEELNLAEEIYRDLRESTFNRRTPELAYLGFVKHIPDRTGLEQDLEELKRMIYEVGGKMAEIERKSIAKGNKQRRIYSQFGIT